MENSLTINTGTVELTINGDPARTITFDPTDLLFVEKFYRLMQLLDEKRAEYDRRAKALRAEDALDANGLPVHVGEHLALIRDACEYLRAQIDLVFGDGTSQVAFGDAMNLKAITQFFQGVSPYLRSAREEKIKKYVPSETAVKRARHSKKK